MSFLKDLGNKITDVAGDAADKAKELAEVQKLKMDISSEEKKVQQAYVNLGKLYFEEIKDFDDGPGADYCKSIIEAQKVIADLEAKIESIKVQG